MNNLDKTDKMYRVYNFSAGPSMLPMEVLETARNEMFNYKGSGQSVMEMSHRSKVYDEIIKTTHADLKELMKIPDNYKILFASSGATTQFAAVPMNLYKTGKADYAKTGQFAGNAIKEAKKYIDVNVVASSEDKTFSYIPKWDESKFNKTADYFHITQNNTIFGTKINTLPPCGDVPIVSDLSSCILSEEFDVSKYGLIYAGAQKNMAPAGVVVVIVRDDLIGNQMDITPATMNYQNLADNDSMQNTPPCYTIYTMGLVLKWLKKLGGISEMEKINIEKANILYNFLDNDSSLFKGKAEKEDRSLMNVTFVTGSDELDNKFVKEAEANGFVNLKGHRSVGGMRASIYNAMPIDGVKELVELMKKFELENK